MFDITRNFCIL